MESPKEVLTKSLKKEDAIEQAVETFYETVKKAMEEREFWRDAELRKAQIMIHQQKQQLDLAVMELVKARKIIAGMKELVGEKQ